MFGHENAKKTDDSKYRTACSQIPMDPMPRRCSNSNSMPGVMKMSKGNPERSTQPAAMSHAAKTSTRPERYLLGESIPKGQGGRYPISDKLWEARSRLYRSRFFFFFARLSGYSSCSFLKEQFDFFIFFMFFKDLGIPTFPL